MHAQDQKTGWDAVPLWSEGGTSIKRFAVAGEMSTAFWKHSFAAAVLPEARCALARSSASWRALHAVQCSALLYVKSLKNITELSRLDSRLWDEQQRILIKHTLARKLCMRSVCRVRSEDFT